MKAELTFNICFKGETNSCYTHYIAMFTVHISGTMEKQRLASIGLRIVFHLILFILFVQFYLIEQMGDYIKDRATTTSRLEQVSVIDFPTLTICMDPPFKPSVVSKYGFKSSGEAAVTDVPNATLLEKLETMSYMLNLDFSMKITSWYSKDIKDIDLKLGENVFFLIEPVITFLQGICYRLTPTFQVENEWVNMGFHIQFKSGDMDKPSHFLVYLTSPNALLNIATNVWPQYMPGKVKVSFNSETISVIRYDKVIKYTFKNGVQNASECMKQVIDMSDCNHECCHISGCSLPICNSSQGYDCLWFNNKKLGKRCLLQKHSLAYLPILEDSAVYDQDSSSSGVFIISTTSDTIQIIEEIDLITLAGLIGSIGGSLGMFFGFSLTSYLFFAIEKFTKKIFKP